MIFQMRFLPLNLQGAFCTILDHDSMLNDDWISSRVAFHFLDGIVFDCSSVILNFLVCLLMCYR